MYGCGEQEVGVASGSGWNLWVWLVVVVVRSSSVAKPGSTRAWARASASRTFRKRGVNVNTVRNGLN